MRQQQRQGHRGHAIDATGLADGTRPHRLQLLLDLAGKTAEQRVVDPFRQLEPFVAAKRNDVGRLAIEIDRVFRVDFKLCGDRRWNIQKRRPDPPDLRNADLGMGQELKGRTPLAVLAELDAEPARFGRGDGERPGAIACGYR